MKKEVLRTISKWKTSYRYFVKNFDAMTSVIYFYLKANGKLSQKHHSTLRKEIKDVLTVILVNKKAYQSAQIEGEQFNKGQDKVLKQLNGNLSNSVPGKKMMDDEFVRITKLYTAGIEQKGRKAACYAELKSNVTAKQVAATVVFYLMDSFNFSEKQAAPLSAMGTVIAKQLYERDKKKKTIYGRQLIELALIDSKVFTIKEIKADKTVKQSIEINSKALHGAIDMISELADNGFWEMPTTVKPIDWKFDTSIGKWTGGYEHYQEPLIRGGKEESKLRGNKSIIRALNAIQAVPFRINKEVLKTVIADIKEPLRKKYANTKVGQSKYDSDFGKYRSLLMAIEIAKKYQNKPEIYFPHNFDYRGRIYPIPKIFTTQGCKEIKGMLESAVGQTLLEDGEEQLFAYIAGTFGFDKKPYKKRVRLGKMLFHSNVKYKKADEKYIYLQAIKAMKDHKLGKPVHMFIHFDGSCNGLQHLSTITKCEAGAKAVNLTASKKREDVYKDVAQKAYNAVFQLNTETFVRSISTFVLKYNFNVEELQLMEDACVEITNTGGEAIYSLFKGKTGRKVAKRPTMIKPYGGTLDGIKGYTANEVAEINEKIAVKPIINILGKILKESVDSVVYGGNEFEKWIKEVGSLIGKSGKQPRWITPDGFPVVLNSYKSHKTEVKFRIGKKTKKIVLSEPTKEVNRYGIRNNISPNFVHSMDATHLRMTLNKILNEGITNTWFIHDSFAVLPNDAKRLNKAIREQFIKLYAPEFNENYFNMFQEQVKQDIKPIPIVGNYNVKSVVDNEYFFS